MTVSFVSANWLVPNDWQTALAPRVTKLSIPELNEALGVAKTILEGRSDTEIQSLARGLVQLVAPDATLTDKGVPLVFVLEPRDIYEIYRNDLMPPQYEALSLLGSLAVGTLIALNRACKAADQSMSNGTSSNVCAGIASARAFSEWLYLVSSLKSNADVLENLFPRQVRTAVKKKISAKASSKSKAYWSGELGPEKKKVIEAYEAGKPWKDTKAAATKIHGDEVTTAVMYDKLYKWLLAYANGKSF